MKGDTIYEPRKNAAEVKLYLRSILSHNDQVSSHGLIKSTWFFFSFKVPTKLKEVGFNTLAINLTDNYITKQIYINEYASLIFFPVAFK